MEREHFEFDLSIGETLQIGDILVTVVDSDTDGVAVLVERLSGDEPLDVVDSGLDGDVSRISRAVPR